MQILVVKNPEQVYEPIDNYLSHGQDQHDITNVECLNCCQDELAKKSYDLIILSLELPGSKGVETVKKLKTFVSESKKNSHTPFIVLTSKKDYESGMEAFELGARDFIFQDECDSMTLDKSITYAAYPQLCALPKRKKGLFSPVVNMITKLFSKTEEPPCSNCPHKQAAKLLVEKTQAA